MLALTLSLALGPLLFFGSALIVASAGYVVYQCFFSPIAAFPGPFAAKFTKIWRAYATYRGQWHREIMELHRRYGNVVRIGPNELSVGDPEAFRTIYRVNGAFVKSACYAVLQGSRPFDLTGERNEKIHSAQRRLVARPYSMESVAHLEPQVTHLIGDLLIKFDSFAASSRPIDIGTWFQLFAFDVIGAISFTKPFGFVALANDDGMLTRIERSLGNTAWLMHVPWIFNFHQKYILPVFGNFLRANDRNDFFFNFAKSEVQGRRDKGGIDNDLVGQLFQAAHSKTELNDLVISFMMTSNVFAGSDTTSAALRGIFLNLLRHPRVLSKLRAELEEQRAAGRLSSIVTFQEAEASPYLQAVMHEAMRVFSPVGFNPDRDVPEGGMMINGILVPGGTVVGSNAWVIHRVPEVWGADFEQFRPERWLERESSSELKRFFFAFGGGTRTCIGKNISWLEIGKLVATLVMRYDFELVDDANITESCR
ncbi:Pisatin demethylase [Trichoderma lentiforme]|uniref:Pisatin demethylase n=1 Tax=Trichoderma lentiforme TaxID=1567552 RepID=A0A9P4XJB1_9HYPO|nr:Pisatin demethylase [Trichoderma lentiforme]